ncbi:TolC family protein [Planctomycetaceae bacterium SH139]
MGTEQSMRLTLLASLLGCCLPGCAQRQASPAARQFTAPASKLISQDAINADNPATSVDDANARVQQVAYPDFEQAQTQAVDATVAAASPLDFNPPQIDNRDLADNSAESPTDNSAESAGVPLEEYVSLALAQHPRILAARSRMAAEQNRIAQVTALPEPVFNNTFWPLSDQALQTAGGRMGNQMSLQQRLPWPEKLKAAGRVVSREVQMAQAEVERIEREVTEAVQLAYFELWYTSRALEIVTEGKLVADDLLTVAGARYRSGGSQQDVLRAQTEADRLINQEYELQQQLAAARADLATLVRQPVELVPIPVVPPPTVAAPERLQQLILRAEQCSPELRGLAWQVERDRQRQQAACWTQYPDLQFGLNWGLISDAQAISPVADGHDNLSFSVGTTLPIWRRKYQAGIREAAHRTQSSIQQLAAEREQLYGGLRRLVAQADSLAGQAETYEQRLLPRAQTTLNLVLADYRGGRANFDDLVATYRELLLFETQLARVQANLAGTLARIERQVGCRVDSPSANPPGTNPPSSD